MQQTVFREVSWDNRQPARLVKVLHQIVAGGLEVHERGHAGGKPIPVIDRQFDPDTARTRGPSNESPHSLIRRSPHLRGRRPRTPPRVRI